MATISHMEIKPVSYSRAQTVADVKKYLEAAPTQKDNSPEAFAGLVLEFLEAPGAPVGTLSEFYRYNSTTLFRIVCNDGYLVVAKQEDNFVVVSTHGTTEELPSDERLWA